MLEKLSYPSPHNPRVKKYTINLLIQGISISNRWFNFVAENADDDTDDEVNENDEGDNTINQDQENNKHNAAKNRK